MTILEQNIIDTLIDLKENHKVLSVKAEFEDEGASFDEVFRLNELVKKSGLGLTLKISGCGALNDINQAKTLGVKSIVAPMIESSYALKKFIQAVNTVYTDKTPELFINIETIMGCKNFNEILEEPDLKYLTGIVVGRFDMAKSIGLACKDCDGERIFDIVNDLAIKTQKKGKCFAIGGGVGLNSLKFFYELEAPLHRFETRKIVFDADYVLKNEDIKGIEKAINFEIMWIEAKQKLYGIFNSNDDKRLQRLLNRREEFEKFNTLIKI